MPRSIKERWAITGFDVKTEHLPLADDNGQPQYDNEGGLVTAEYTVLILVDETENRVVEIPLAAEDKQTLMAKLTTGIIIPAGHEPIPHLPFGRGI